MVLGTSRETAVYTTNLNSISDRQVFSLIKIYRDAWGLRVRNPRRYHQLLTPFIKSDQLSKQNCSQTAFVEPLLPKKRASRGHRHGATRDRPDIAARIAATVTAARELVIFYSFFFPLTSEAQPAINVSCPSRLHSKWFAHLQRTYITQICGIFGDCSALLRRGQRSISRQKFLLYFVLGILFTGRILAVVGARGGRPTRIS
jgi:hypothetical protein